MEGGETSSQGIPCTICGKYLSSYSSLCDHKRIHTGDRPHICQICNKRFTQKAHLSIHRRTHTGEKPYSCTICFKRFAQSSHLKNHKRIHTGEKAYICQICNIGFNQKPRLEKHLASHFDGKEKVDDDKNYFDAVNLNDDPMDFTRSKQDFLDGKDGCFDEENADQEYFFRGNKFSGMTDVKFDKSDGFMGLVNLKQEALSPASDFVEMGDNPTIPGVSGLLDDANSLANKVDKRKMNKRKPASVKRIHRSNENSDVDGDVDDDLDYFLKPVDAVDNTESFSTDLKLTEYTKEIKSLTGDEVIDNILHQNTSQNSSSDAHVTSTENRANSGSDDVDRVSNASESNYSSDTGGNHGPRTPQPTTPQPTTSMLHGRHNSRSSPRIRQQIAETTTSKANLSSYVRTNNRICLVDFTTDDLLTHMMSRDDVHKCDFCCVIFQDQAMYHLHRSMHDKFDIRACNLCGKVSRDKHDFIAHFLSEHK